MQELSQGHVKVLIEQLTQNQRRLDQEHRELIGSLESDRVQALQQLQELIAHYRSQRDEEHQEWSEKTKGELVKFQRDTDELYQRCSDTFEEIHDEMETAQEELKKSQTSIDEMSKQLSASVDASISRETALRESIMDVLEIRLENSLEQVDLVKTAVSRLMELNLELKAQVKSQSAVIKELEEHRDKLISGRIFEMHTELLNQVKGHTEDVQRMGAQEAEVVEEVNVLRKELLAERQKQTMNCVIAALVGVVGWFF